MYSKENTVGYQRKGQCWQAAMSWTSNFTKPKFWVENNFKFYAFKGQWKLKTLSSQKWGEKEEKPIENGNSWIPQYVCPIHWFYM